MTTTAHGSSGHLPPLETKMGPFATIKLGDPNFTKEFFIEQAFGELDKLTFGQRVVVTLLAIIINCLSFPFRLLMMFYQLLIDMLRNLLIKHVWRTFTAIVLIIAAINSYACHNTLWELDQKLAVWIHTL